MFESIDLNRLFLKRPKVRLPLDTSHTPSNASAIASTFIKHFLSTASMTTFTDEQIRFLVLWRVDNVRATSANSIQLRQLTNATGLEKKRVENWISQHKVRFLRLAKGIDVEHRIAHNPKFKMECMFVEHFDEERRRKHNNFLAEEAMASGDLLRQAPPLIPNKASTTVVPLREVTASVPERESTANSNQAPHTIHNQESTTVVPLRLVTASVANRSSIPEAPSSQMTVEALICLKVESRRRAREFRRVASEGDRRAWKFSRLASEEDHRGDALDQQLVDAMNRKLALKTMPQLASEKEHCDDALEEQLVDAMNRKLDLKTMPQLSTPLQASMPSASPNEDDADRPTNQSTGLINGEFSASLTMSTGSDVSSPNATGDGDDSALVQFDESFVMTSGEDSSSVGATGTRHLKKLMESTIESPDTKSIDILSPLSFYSTPGEGAQKSTCPTNLTSSPHSCARAPPLADLDALSLPAFFERESASVDSVLETMLSISSVAEYGSCRW